MGDDFVSGVVVVVVVVGFLGDSFSCACCALEGDWSLSIINLIWLVYAHTLTLNGCVKPMCASRQCNGIYISKCK